MYSLNFVIDIQKFYKVSLIFVEYLDEALYYTLPNTLFITSEAIYSTIPDFARHSSNEWHIAL
jgi:hypothetical protein